MIVSWHHTRVCFLISPPQCPMCFQGHFIWLKCSSPVVAGSAWWMYFRYFTMVSWRLPGFTSQINSVDWSQSSKTCETCDMTSFFPEENLYSEWPYFKLNPNWGFQSNHVGNCLYCYKCERVNRLIPAVNVWINRIITNFIQQMNYWIIFA